MNSIRLAKSWVAIFDNYHQNHKEMWQYDDNVRIDRAERSANVKSYGGGLIDKVRL